VAAHQTLTLYPSGNRAYDVASYWLAYDGNYVVPADTSLPEYHIVPNTANGAIENLEVAGNGVYIREFISCTIAGIPTGPCAAIVNTGSADFPIPTLNQTYTQAEDFSDPTTFAAGGVVKWGPIPVFVAGNSGLILGTP